MLFIKSHRMKIQPEGYNPYEPDGKHKVSATAACGFPTSQAYPPMATAPFGRFDYFFPEARPTPHETNEVLNRLADSMVDKAQQADDNTDVPAIITYLGQFIDHDITAGTDRQSKFSDIDVYDVVPKSRKAVVENVANLRTGALDLDSLYGGAALQGDFATEMSKRLRHPTLKSKLRIGTDVFVPPAGPRPKRPRSQHDDPAHDLLRVERLIRDEDPLMTDLDLDALPDDLRDFLVDEETGEPNLARAVIGDGRNDENLAVATVHLSFARLHNRIVDHAPSGTEDEKYEWAKQRVRWIYQWLIVNVYLPQICDAETLKEVVESDAAFYKAFLERAPHEKGHMPLPLEFSVAAFRFGHSSARPDYDWSGNFGRADGTVTPIEARASFPRLFTFTGNGRMGGFTTRLPSGWLVDMPRFLNCAIPTHSDRNTRLIDTRLAPPLHMLPNEQMGTTKVLRNLPRRNLRRSQLLSIPSAQACIEGFQQHKISIPQLSAAQLTAGLDDTTLPPSLQADTPLWFYILKEAEVLNKGMRLGPLGTRIVAETLVGLIWYGTGTYRSQSGSDRGVWHPRDDVQPEGEPIAGLPQMMRAALMM